MSAETDAGLLALQGGDANEAIAQLERAIAADPNDYQAHQYLGAAYGQAGRQMEAVTTLTQAVTLQPSNAQARYNLAIAYEGAGYKEQALVAAQQALQLQPDYPKAQEAVARLSGTPMAPAYVQPAAPQYGELQQPTPYGQPTAPQYGQPQQQPPSGGYEPGRTAPPLYGTPASASYPPQANAGIYQGQGAAAYGGSPAAAYYTPPPRPGVMQTPDKFDMKQGVADWVRVIREPHAFFREQADREGYNAPISFLVVFGIGIGVLTLLSVLVRMMIEPLNASMAVGQVFGGVFGFVGGITGALIGAFVWGAVLHMVGRLFGNRQVYQKSFRVAAYSRAPMLIFTVVTAIITPFVLPLSAFTPPAPSSSALVSQVTPVQYSDPPNPFGLPGRRTTDSPGGMTRPTYGGTGTPNPFDSPGIQKLIHAYEIIGPISLIGLIWIWCLQAIGLRYAQNLSPSGAAGTVFVALLVPFLLLLVIGALFGVLIAAALGSSRGRPPGLENILSMVRPALAVWRGY